MRQETLPTGRRDRLHGRLWIPDDDPPVGVVIVVHGLGDHGGRYEELARYLAPRHWAVFAFDLPGHGHSPGVQGRADSYAGLLSDIDHAAETVKQRFPGATRILLGHSMGGNLAINHVLRNRVAAANDDAARSTSDLAGLVLCGPMLLPPQPPPRPQIFAA